MKKYQIQIFVVVFGLLITTNVSTLAVSQSLIGVKEGEEYTYVVEKYSLYYENPNEIVSETVDYMYGNEGTIALEDGDEFTIRILNATAYDRTTEPVTVDGLTLITVYFNPFAIDVEIIGPNGTTVTDDLSIGFGELMMDTNWTSYKNELEESSVAIEDRRQNNPDITYIFDIIDTKSEFGIKIGKSFSGNVSDPDTYSDIKEIRYEKTSGMINFVSVEDIRTQTIDDTKYIVEYIRKFARKDYSFNGDDAFLDGFTLYFSIFALLVLNHNRKKFK